MIGCIHRNESKPKSSLYASRAQALDACEGILRKYIVHPNVSDIPRDSYIYAITK